MRARRRAVIAPLAVAVLVASCSSGDTGGTDAHGGDEPAARWTQATLPSSAMLAADRVELTDVLGDTETLPSLVVGLVAEPGGPDRLRLWTSTDAETWDTTDPDIGEGEVEVWAAVSDGTTTTVAGHVTPPGEPRRPFVLTSDDRATWDTVDLPPEAVDRGVRFGAVHRRDDALVLLGTDIADRPVAVRTGPEAEVVDLPLPAPDDELRPFRGLAAAGDTLVAVAGSSRPGELPHPVVYRSTDAGASWELAVPSLAPDAEVLGVAWTGEAFVATGFEIRDARYPASWWSSDGLAWEQDRAPVPEDPRWHHWLGPPTAHGERILAAVGDSENLRSIVAGRSASGMWDQLVGSTTPWIAPGAAGRVAVQQDGSILVVRTIRNSGVVDRLAGEGRVGRVLELGPADDGVRWRDVTLVDGRPELNGVRTTVAVEPDGRWERTREVVRFALTEGATASEAELGLPEAEGLSELTVLADERGGTVAIGVQEPSSDDRAAVDEADLVGWYRAGPGGAWEPVDGLDGPGVERPRGLHRVGDQWAALGSDRATSDAAGDHAVAAVWLSDDGRRWTRQDGPFDVAPGRDSWASGACALPTGGLLVVGGASQSDGADGPVLWRGDGGTWTPIDAAALGERAGPLSSCVTRDGVTLLQGTDAGRPMLWRTTDLETFEAVVLDEQSRWGDEVGRLRQLDPAGRDGGFVAAGTRRSGGRVDAVVWLSADGERWEAVPAPANRSLEGIDVVSWDGRVVLAATSDSGPEVWILENPAELLPG